MRRRLCVLMILAAGVGLGACGGDDGGGSAKPESGGAGDTSADTGGLSGSSKCSDWKQASSEDKTQVLVSLGWKESAAPDIAKRVDDACARQGESLGDLKGQSDFLAGAFPDKRAK